MGAMTSYVIYVLVDSQVKFTQVHLCLGFQGGTNIFKIMNFVSLFTQQGQMQLTKYLW